MRDYSKIVLLGLLGVVAFDALASIASRVLGFWYVYATVGSWLIYGVVGFFAGRLVPLSAAAVGGAVVAFGEATVGWKVSCLIGPGCADVTLTVGVIVFTIFFVTLVGAIIAAVGSIIGRRWATQAAKMA